MKPAAKISPSLLISIALAVTVWAIFYPGTLSADSLATYEQASMGRLTDIRPPFLTIALALVLKAGGGLGSFTLLECLLGYLGVRRLLLAVTGLFDLEPHRQEWIASLGLLILSTPLTPMPVYFVTLWFDSWLAIFLLWTIAILLELWEEMQNPDLRGKLVKIFAALLLITIVMLSRWNSLILYPLLALIFAAILRRGSFSPGSIFLLSVLPAVFYLLFLVLQYQVIRVERVHTERFVFGLDLASMIVYDPAVCETLALQGCQIIQGKITSEFVPGNGAIDHTMNQGLGRIESAFASLLVSPDLPRELWVAAARMPLSFVKVKLLNFYDYLRPRPRYYFQSFIHANGWGLVLNERFAAVRNRYVGWLHAVYSHPVLMMVSFAHWTWIAVNLVLLCCLWIRAPGYQPILAWILCVPLLYVLSYLLALTSSDFRYMYPATLLMQVLAIGLLASLPWRQKRRRMPSPSV